MPPDKVETVRRALTEFDEAHRLSDAHARDLVFDTRTDRSLPDHAEFRGWDSFYEFFEGWIEAYEEWENEIEDVLDAGDNRVVALVHQRARLRGSEGWVERRFALVYTVDGGLIRRIQVYDPAEDALKAVGLSEQ